MKIPFKIIVSVAAVLAVAACNAGGISSLPGTAQPSAAQTGYVPQWEAKHLARRVCNDDRLGYMNCDVLLPATGGFGPNISGWTAPELQARYNLPSDKKGAGQVVAIVDAFDNPNVLSDINFYRKQFNLGTAKIKKYNQEGQQKNYPQGSPHWGVEIDLDVEMVSASCPKCSIILVEANSNSGNDLYASEVEAAKLGAKIISNSWGGGGGSPSGGSFDQKGILYLASAGDYGYGPQDPADYSTVVAVGGTVLSGSGKNYNEIVWPDSGGGCSVVMKPSWQKDPKCKNRLENDLSAVAVSVAEYDTYSQNGWIAPSGTSISSPLVAGMYGLAENSTKQDAAERLWGLSKPDVKKDFHYVKFGELGGCPKNYLNTYICKAGTKQFGTYSGGSGWGTPNGVGAL
ncbi:MAG TPA: S8 family serine peptidase [Candidatus Cybelea sp.]